MRLTISEQQIVLWKHLQAGILQSVHVGAQRCHRHPEACSHLILAGRCSGAAEHKGFQSGKKIGFSFRIERLLHALLERVTGCEYDIAVITNITGDHLDFHGTFENYVAAKAKLFSMLGDAVHKVFPDVKVVRVPGQSDLMFCREQGCLSLQELHRALRQFPPAHQEAARKEIEEEERKRGMLR